MTEELVHLHGGKIEVDSEVGKGSTFKVKIPLNIKRSGPIDLTKTSIPEATESVIKNAAITLEEVIVDEGNPILVIVEDNLYLSEYIAKTLSDQFTVLTASNGIEGLDISLKQIPDLVISDLMMPEMDGLELCEQLKSNEATCHIPIILLTAKANIESRLEGLSTGADDYLTKPFNADELGVRATNLIKQRKLLRDRFSRTVVLKPKDIAITSVDEVFLEKVMSIIEDHMDDSDFSVEDFQSEIGMSRMQLHRKLKALTDHSTTEFIRVQRLKRAGTILVEGGGNVSDVCYQVGFNSLSYFTRSFKEQFGVSPSQYAQSIVKKS